MNKNLNNKIKQVFTEKDYFFDSETDKLIINDHSYNYNVFKYEKVVQDIIKSEDVLFFITEPTPGKKTFDYKNNEIYQTIKYSVINGDAAYMARHFHIYHYNPYVELFIKNAIGEPGQKINESYLFKQSITEKADLFNEFVDVIRAEANSPQFKKTISNYNRGLSKNYKNLVDYIDAIFKSHKRLLVLRVDFAYGAKEKGNNANQPLTIDEKYLQAKSDREHFFNNMRSNRHLFRHMLGYVWKLEYGIEAGFHYHMFFFFNGSKVQQDINRSKMIGEYWNTTITEGRGRYYNCNANKLGYKSLGIGMVKRTDEELVANLKKAAEYFTKADYYAKVVVQDKGRTFGKGVFKPKRRNASDKENSLNVHSQVTGIQSVMSAQA